ncbi:MAG: Gfo/Idh/MocA family oxidoreductase, partial [Acidobacteria bacterium]|nr:Gfo/Idh/MocA family oxidoreductase [Acidobacteriota bacterium]
FRGPADAISGKLRLNSPRVYGGIDGFRALAHSKLDAVVVTSPPYFHPEHVQEAVGAGKHVYIAKPVAVDVAGCQSIQAAAGNAAGKLSVWVDWQTRRSPAFQEAARRVHQGEIGEPVMAMAGFHGGILPRKDTAGMTADQARLANWVFDKALSGDIIVEQNIHMLDVANWFLRSRPLKAFGTAGRKARVAVGDTSDHFIVTYWYPNGVKVDFSGTQFLKGGRQIFTRLYGSEGSVLAYYGGALSIEGSKPWKGVPKDATMGYTVENVKGFVESIRGGAPINNVATGVESTLSAILGRIASEREQIVTWDEMLKADQKHEIILKV